MKIRRLSEIDLARFSALNSEKMLERALMAYEAGGGSWSYEPVRSSTADLLNAVTPLFDDMAPVTWPSVKRQMERACTHGDVQRESNVGVGKVLFDTARLHGWKAVKVEMGRMPIGLNETVRFWADVVVDDGEGPFIPFFDHRRDHGLAALEARRVALSMQDAWIRARHPDLSDARLAIVHFPPAGDDRSIVLDFNEGVSLMTYEELNGRVRNIYEKWAEVSQVKMEKKRSTGTGGPESFAF
ncbi:MAG: hypothetical protein H0X27_00990 [Caulobacteraceae bacterium]|nr:hypothetical protein [Caulobacteraceae bacterium]